MKHFDPFPLGYFKINWQAFGQMVLEMREANGLNLRDAAKLLDISAATISRVERGYSVEPDHFFTLLQFVGVTPNLPERMLEVGTPIGTQDNEDMAGTYTQCRLQRGAAQQVAWIPSEFAIRNKYIRIKDVDGWRVVSVGAEQ